MSDAPENPHNPQLPYFPTAPIGAEELARQPARFVHTVELGCDPSTLFDIFEDAEAWTVWVLGISAVEWTSPFPLVPGATRTVIFTGGMEVYETFFAWDRGREMAFAFTGITQPIWHHFAERYVVDDLGGGRCRLTWTVAYTPRGIAAVLHPITRPFAWLLFGLFMRRLRRYVAVWVAQRT